jgi:hypothetical protein
MNSISTYLKDVQKELKQTPDYEKAYLEGKFGGVPYIREFPDFLFKREEKENSISTS